MNNANKIGNDVVQFVEDIERFKRTGTSENPTWAIGGGKTEKRWARNIMGFQFQQK